MQTSPAPHATPQSPQLLGFVVRSTHFFPHFVYPESHLHLLRLQCECFGQHLPSQRREEGQRLDAAAPSAWAPGIEAVPMPIAAAPRRRSAARREISPDASSRASASKSLPEPTRKPSHH